MTASAASGVGLIGCGSIAVTRHIPAWLGEPSGYRLTAVADPTPARRELARETANLPEESAVADYTEILQRDDIGVVDACVPPGARPAIVIAAAASGRHVLCEKPFATIPVMGQQMVDAASSAGVTLGVVHNYLFFPEIMRVRKAIADGAIGNVEVVIMNYLGVRDDPGNSDYRPAWRHDPAEAGGGVLMDLQHVVYLAEAFLGKPTGAVSAFMTARTAGAPVEELVSLRLETDDAVAIINLAWGVGPGGIQIMGSHGRLSINYEGGGTSPFSPLESVELVNAQGRKFLDIPTTQDFLRPSVDDFAAAVREGRRPVADGAAALHVLEATLAAYASAATGRTTAVPFDRADPVYLRGVHGLPDLSVSEESAIYRKGMFGLGHLAERRS